MVRRPWNEQGTPTPMVNDVTWAAGEEPKPEFVPEE